MRYIAKYPVEALCDGFFVFYAMWSLAWMFGYLLGVPFATLAPIFLLLFPVSFFLIALRRTADCPDMSENGRRSGYEYITLFAAILAAVLLTLVLHRPDADDEVYLGLAVALLLHAHEPLGTVPGFGPIAEYVSIHGFDANTQALSAYQPLKAMLSYVTGLPLLTSNYLVVPALMSAMVVVLSYRLLKEFLPDAWLPAMLFFFVVMLAWGDAHRTLANFGFVRMFQGKAVLVTLVVPALIFYFLQCFKSFSWRYPVVMLTAVAISGVGFSRGGLAIIPLLMGMLMLASIPIYTRRRNTFVLPLLSLISVFIVLFGYHDHWILNPAQVVHSPRGLVDSTTHTEMLRFTLGEGFRGMFLLTMAGISFIFVKNIKIRYIYRNYLVVFFLLLLIPWTSNLLAKTVFLTMSWRWMWVLPIPLLASVAVGGALLRLRLSAMGDTFAVLLVMAVAFVYASPRLVVSAENDTYFGWPEAKISGDTIYLEPLQTAAFVKDGLLYLDGGNIGY